MIGAALNKMIKDGFEVKEVSLEFDFEGEVSTRPWPPGQKLMDYIKNVSAIYHRIQLLSMLRNVIIRCMTYFFIVLHKGFH